jgi:hypothetical protein
MTFDETKELILSTVSGLTMNELPHGDWDIGGVFITEVKEELVVSGKPVVLYSVNYAVPIVSNDRMEPDDVDVVEVGSFFSLEAAIPCAIQTCIDMSIDSAQNAEAENDYANQINEEQDS